LTWRDQNPAGTGSLSTRTPRQPSTPYIPDHTGPHGSARSSFGSPQNIGRKINAFFEPPNLNTYGIASLPGAGAGGGGSGGPSGSTSLSVSPLPFTVPTPGSAGGPAGKVPRLTNRRSSPFSSFSEKNTARGAYVGGTGYDEEDLNLLTRTFSIVSASLLQRCIVGEGNFLALDSCITHNENPDTGVGPGQAAALLQLQKNSFQNGISFMDSIQEKSTIPIRSEKDSDLGIKRNINVNILFSVRDFLEILSEQEQIGIIPYIKEICNFSKGASMRILKLINCSLFTR
jgi:hypothetical protein